MKKKIGLLGLGTVGKGVFKVINSSNKHSLLSDLEISKIGIKSLNKPRFSDELHFANLLAGKLTIDLKQIVTAPEIDIVVEVMGGIETTKELIVEALKHEKSIVTANKALLATHGDELFRLAKDKGVQIYFEASVAGGIPIIQCLQKSLRANKLRSITGIVNGTTNYILTQMTQKRITFDTALKNAMEKGYAEADPTADIDAIDATQKLAILARVGFGVSVDYQKIFRQGIRSISSQDITLANSMNYTIKLLANAQINNQKYLHLNVQPYLVKNTHPLAAINGVFNAIVLEGEPVGQLMLYGQGAGEGATASAVVSDLVNCLSTYSNSQITQEKNTRLASASQKTKNKFYLRLLTEKNPTAVGAIAWSLGDFNISPVSVRQKITLDESLEIAIITESVSRNILDNALTSISGLPYLKKVANVLPILEKP